MKRLLVPWKDSRSKKDFFPGMNVGFPRPMRRAIEEAGGPVVLERLPEDPSRRVQISRQKRIEYSHPMHGESLLSVVHEIPCGYPGKVRLFYDNLKYNLKYSYSSPALFFPTSVARRSMKRPGITGQFRPVLP